MNKQDSLRVQMVLPSVIRAGMETVVSALAMDLVRRGHHVNIACLVERGDLDLPAPPGGPEIQVVSAGSLLRPKGLQQHLRSQAPDVVHVHSGSGFVAARALAGLRDLPCLYTIHGRFDQPDRPAHREWLERITCRSYDRVIAVSLDLHSYAIHRLWVPDSKVEFIPNGIDARRFRPGRDTLRSRLGIDDNAFVVGTVARLTTVKNQALMIDGFARFHLKRPDAHLLIAGDGPLRGELEEKVASHGLNGRVHFLGSVPDTLPVYRALDVFALTSVSEGLSISLLEAMAVGVPVVATPVGGNPWLLADGARGALIEVPNPEGLADLFERIRVQPESARGRTEVARSAVLSHFSVEAMTERYIATYRSVRGRPATR